MAGRALQGLRVLIAEDNLFAAMELEKVLVDLGCEPVGPENPYWAEKGFTFEDPDGWRVVLMNTAGIKG